jgi:glycosyltransferase involved in cell wall biosynthesis
VGDGDVKLRARRADPCRRIGRAQALTVVMAVYNEASTVAQAIDEVLDADLDGRQLELIIVEGSSTDGTRQIVEKYLERAQVHVVFENRPSGKGAAVRTGFDHATGDVILIQDGDLEYSVGDYASLLAPIEAGTASFVLGSRHVKGQPMRYFEESWITSGVMNVAHWMFAALFDVVYGVRLRDPFTMYKVFRRECLDDLEFVCNRFDFDWELVAKLIRRGHRPVEVPVTYESRDFASGKKVRLLRDPLSWLVALVRFRVVRLEARMEALPQGAEVGGS